MVKVEGVKAPPIRGDKWFGKEVTTASREGRVTVLRFMSPMSKMTRNAIDTWKKTSKEMSPQGVVFLGVCDHMADWERMKSLLGEESEVPFSVVCDVPPKDEEGVLPLGVTATAYGVRMWPTTVVIDRSGHVRAVGLREEQLSSVIDKLMAEPIDATR